MDEKKPHTGRAEESSLAQIRRSIAAMEAGEKGKPLDQFVEEFRKLHNIPKDA